MPWDTVESLLDDHPLERLTKRTITDRADLRHELEITARRGFALDNEERAPGVICIGAAIRDFSGDVVGAISVSAPSVRLSSRKIDAYSDLVRASAEEASRRLGALYPEAR